MKLNKKLYSIISSLLLTSLITGCNHKADEEIKSPLPEQPVEIEEEIILDIEVLKSEYESIIDLMLEVINVIDEDGIGNVFDAVGLVDYINKNRIEPTQVLTIKLNDQLDSLIELGVELIMTRNEENKIIITEQIGILLEEMEVTIIEIETLLANYGEL